MSVHDGRAEAEDGTRFFHRIETSTQSFEDAMTQVDSGELWGHPARGSDIPKVKAWNGRLPEDAFGIEFTTDVAPDPHCVPHAPMWSGPRDGVRRRRRSRLWHPPRGNNH